MTEVPVQLNLFLNYAKGINFEPEEMRGLIQENIRAIAQNALTTSSINLSQINQVVPLSLNTRTLRFIPTSFFNTITSLGFVDQNGKHIQDFLDFLAVSLADLPFISAELLQHKEKLDYGLTYLSESYRLSNRRVDSEIVARSLKSLSCLSASCALVQGSTDSIRNVSPILEYERYAPIKKMITPKMFASKSRFEKILGNDFPHFFAACLRLKEGELEAFTTKINKILTAEKGASKTDQILLELLHDERFAAIHETCLKKLLRAKKSLEDQEKFELRATTPPVKEALALIRKKIGEASDEKALAQLVGTYQLDSVPPYCHVRYFVLLRWDMPDDVPFPVSFGNHSFLRFMAKALLSLDNLENPDLTSHEARVRLLKAAEFLFLEASNSDIKKERVANWVKKYPEYIELPELKSFILKL